MGNLFRQTIILHAGSYEKRINDCNFLKELRGKSGSGMWVHKAKHAE